MKSLLLVTNLFPRPDMPRCGVFNAQFAQALGSALGVPGSEFGVKNSNVSNDISAFRFQPLSHVPRSTPYALRSTLLILVPVPEWRIWRHSRIRNWHPPEEALSYASQYTEPGTPAASLRAIGVPTGRSAAANPEPLTPCVSYVPHFYLPVIGRNLSNWFLACALRRYRELFETCDAVMGSWLYPDCVAAATIAKETGRPFWARLHGTDRFHLDAHGRGTACHRALDQAEGVFVNAESMRRELMDRGVDESKIHIVRNGVDRAVFKPDASNNSEHITRNTERMRSILWVGNLVPIKGPDIALRTFYKVLGSELGVKGSELRLCIAGEGPMRSKLECLARELGISEQVEFLGSIPHEEVAEWMNAADCLLLTSRSEGMPNVVVEALASGIPVVATDVGDVPAVVRDGVNGRVVAWSAEQGAGSREKKDVAIACSLAAALNDVLNKDWDTTTIQATVSEYDWTRTADAVLGIVAQEPTCVLTGHNSELGTPNTEHL